MCVTIINIRKIELFRIFRILLPVSLPYLFMIGLGTIVKQVVFCIVDIAALCRCSDASDASENHLMGISTHYVICFCVAVWMYEFMMNNPVAERYTHLVCQRPCSLLSDHE